MKKNEKKCILQVEETSFLYLKTALFWLVLWLCISKTICRAQEGTPITF